MDNVSGQRDCLHTVAICNLNVRGYVIGQVRVLVTQLPFVNHYVVFGVRRGNAELSRFIE
jgi:hypothetical protein